MSLTIDIAPWQKRPAPNGKVWASAYTDDKKEYYEIRTLKEDGVTPVVQWHKEYPLGIGIADFAAEDLPWFDEILEMIEEHANNLKTQEDKSFHINSLFDISKLWLGVSPVYAPLTAAVERLQLDPNTDEIHAMIGEYKRLQDEVRYLLRDCFELEEKSDNMRAWYFERAAKNPKNYPVLRYGESELSVCIRNTKLHFVYDGDILNYLFHLDTSENILGDFFHAEILNCTQPQDLVYFMLCRYLEKNIRFRVCKYCGKYFGVVNNYKPEYCNRLVDNSFKTCKDVGSLRRYEKKQFENPAIKEFKRSYKAHNARIRYGLMTREEFQAWSLEARQKRDKCVAGKMSLEDFVAWLDSDRKN